MIEFDDRPTRQTVRPLHANTQGEGFGEWKGNRAPPTDEETQMAPLQLSPNRNKKLKTDRDSPISRERTLSKTHHKTIQSHYVLQSLCPIPHPPYPNYVPNVQDSNSEH